MMRLVFVLLALCGATASARTLSVDVGGVNNPDAGVFVSLEAALAAVASNDVVLVAPGTYSLPGSTHSYACTGASDVTLRSTSPRRAKISGLTLTNCSRWSIEDFYFDQRVTLGSSSTNDFSGRFVRNLVSVTEASSSTEYALTVYGAPNALIEGNELRATNLYTAVLVGAQPVVRRNHLVGINAAYGLVVYASQAIIENNVFEGTSASALSLHEPAQVLGNLMRVGGSAVLLADPFTAVHDVVFRNNVVEGAPAFSIRYARGLTFEFNTVSRLSASGDVIGAD